MHRLLTPHLSLAWPAACGISSFQDPPCVACGMPALCMTKFDDFIGRWYRSSVRVVDQGISMKHI